MRRNDFDSYFEAIVENEQLKSSVTATAGYECKQRSLGRQSGLVREEPHTIVAGMEAAIKGGRCWRTGHRARAEACPIYAMSKRPGQAVAMTNTAAEYQYKDQRSTSQGWCSQTQIFKDSWPQLDKSLV